MYSDSLGAVAIAEADGGSICDEGDEDDNAGIFPAAGVVDGGDADDGDADGGDGNRGHHN